MAHEIVELAEDEIVEFVACSVVIVEFPGTKLGPLTAIVVFVTAGLIPVEFALGRLGIVEFDSVKPWPGTLAGLVTFELTGVGIVAFATD